MEKDLELPESYGALQQLFSQENPPNLFSFRKTTFEKVEEHTKRPLLCYATKTHNLPDGCDASILDEDLIGFSDLIAPIEGDQVDVFLISNGGSPEATERIVRQLRDRFKHVRFIVPSNAFSAATLMCFSGDEILMLPEGTLGPIDPQIGGVPARAILRAFESLKKKLAQEGAQALTAYVPLLQKYSLHLLEQCHSAEQLSKELAGEWLSSYAMQQLDEEARKAAVCFFSNWDLHKSHSRSIGPAKAKEYNIPVKIIEGPLAKLVRNLFHQYTFFFDKSNFYKVYESAYGTNWGRQFSVVNLVPQLPQSGNGSQAPAPQIIT